MRKEKIKRPVGLINRVFASFVPKASCLAETGGVLQNRCNVVIREVRNRDGMRLTRIAAHHDGSAAGIVAVARRLTDRMWTDFSDASNIESRIVATDDSGKPKWAISPNFNHVAEIGTDEAAFIWGDLTAGLFKNSPDDCNVSGF